MTTTTYFDSSVAPFFVIGTSLFAIFWGVVNAFLVSLTSFNFNSFTF
jgi:hypothetical protein